MSKRPGYVTTNLRLRTGTRRKLEELALEMELSLTAVVEKAINDLLVRERRRAKRQSRHGIVEPRRNMTSGVFKVVNWTESSIVLGELHHPTAKEMDVLREIDELPLDHALLWQEDERVCAIFRGARGTLEQYVAGDPAALRIVELFRRLAPDQPIRVRSSDAASLLCELGEHIGVQVSLCEVADGLESLTGITIAVRHLDGFTIIDPATLDIVTGVFETDSVSTVRNEGLHAAT